MQFSFEEIIPGPIDRVYALLRDRLTDLVPYLEAVDEIQVLERDESEPGRIKIVNLWQGNTRMMPLIARPFVTKAMSRWRDHALWVERDFTIEWWFEPEKFSRLFTCQGKDHFDDLGDGTTRFRITGDLVVYADRVPGVTTKMAAKLGPVIEKWAIAKVKPNLMQVPHALRGFFAEERRAAAPAAGPEGVPEPDPAG
jgi:hypothetical protein